MKETLNQLFETMLAKTESRSLQWHEVDEGIFRASLGMGLVRISRVDSLGQIGTFEQGSDSPESIHIAITDHSGKLVEDLYYSHRDPAYQVVNALHTAARRSALNSHGLIKDMLKSLG